MKENAEISKTTEKIKELLFLIERCIYFFRKLNYDRALRLFFQCNRKLEEILELLFISIKDWKKYGIELNITEVTGMLETLLQIQTQKDYILLADLLEQQIKPWLLFLQEQAGNSGIIEGLEELRKECFNKNLKAIHELRDETEVTEVQYQELSLLLKILESEMSKQKEREYQLEYTSSGAWTCAVEKENRRWYLHSNASPLMEGFLLAEEWLEETISEYGIFGIGLGYAIRAFYEKSEYIQISVYETNASILRMAMSVTDFSDMLKSKRVRLYYQPLEEELPKQLSPFLSTEKKLIIFEPSVRNITAEITKKWLENCFIQISSIQNQKLLLDGNFAKNSARKDASIDSLAIEFAGKDLYIIAAGPSLDKNYMALKKLREKDKREKSLILATGTVFKKLITAGIRPDYVLVTDANRRVLFQIAGVENETVPILYLSTAYYGFAEKYQGEKYIVCQKGFSQAEEYAKECGFPLVQTGGSVSTTALDLGLTLQCKRIIFLGLDLSYPEGFAHAEGTSGRTIIDTKDLRKVKDIYGNLVLTNRSMDMYREWIEQRICLENKIPILDATEGGVKIKGMELTTMQQLLLEV